MVPTADLKRDDVVARGRDGGVLARVAEGLRGGGDGLLDQLFVGFGRGADGLPAVRRVYQDIEGGADGAPLDVGGCLTFVQRERAFGEGERPFFGGEGADAGHGTATGHGHFAGR